MIKKILQYFLRKKHDNSIEERLSTLLSSFDENEFVLGYNPDKSLAKISIQEISNIAIFGGTGSGKTVGFSFSIYTFLLKNLQSTQVINILGDYARNGDYTFFKQFSNYYEFTSSGSIDAFRLLLNEIDKRKSSLEDSLELNYYLNQFPKIFIILDEAIFEKQNLDPELFNKKIKLSMIDNMMQESNKYGIYFFTINQTIRQLEDHSSLLFASINFPIKIVYKTSEQNSQQIFGNNKAALLSRQSFYSTLSENKIHALDLDRKILLKQNITKKYNQNLNKENAYITNEMLDKIKYNS